MIMKLINMLHRLMIVKGWQMGIYDSKEIKELLK